MALADDWKSIPLKVRVALAIALLFLLLVAYWFYFLAPVMAKKADLDRRIQELDENVTIRERVVTEKDRYLKEVKRLNEVFTEAVMRLPDQREIPSLFHAISVAGKEAGLEFLLFEPAPHPKKAKGTGNRTSKGGKKGGAKETEPFYDEIPIKVKVLGNFVDIVYFFDRVAKLPRIVHVSDVQLGEGKYGPGKRRIITTSYTLTTYVFRGIKGHEGK